MIERRSHLDATAGASMVLLCALWGVQQVAIKVANAGIPPVLQGGLRSLGAALLLWGWCALRGVPLFDRDRSLGPGLLAGGLFAAEFLLIYLGLSYTTASRAVLFLYTAPFVVAAGAHLYLPGERLGPAQVAGLVCAFAGIAVAFADGLALPTAGQLAGDLMLLAAAVLWGATTLVVKASRLARVRASKVLFYQLAVSALALPALAPAFGLAAEQPVTPLMLASLGYQIVIVAFASYLAWFWLVARYPAGRLSAFSFLTPLFGVAAGGLLLGERVSPALALALVLVGFGIWLVNRPARG